MQICKLWCIKFRLTAPRTVATLLVNALIQIEVLSRPIFNRDFYQTNCFCSTWKVFFDKRSLNWIVIERTTDTIWGIDGVHLFLSPKHMFIGRLNFSEWQSLKINGTSRIRWTFQCAQLFWMLNFSFAILQFWSQLQSVWTWPTTTTMSDIWSKWTVAGVRASSNRCAQNLPNGKTPRKTASKNSPKKTAFKWD